MRNKKILLKLIILLVFIGTSFLFQQPTFAETQAAQLDATVIQRDGETFIQITNAQKGDTIYLYYGRHILQYSAKVNSDSPIFEINLSTLYKGKYDMRGDFLVARTNENSSIESILTPLNYNFIPLTDPIPASSVSFFKRSNGKIEIKVKYNFSYDGLITLYNENQVRVDEKLVNNGDKESILESANIETLGKHISISVIKVGGRSSEPTIIPVPAESTIPIITEPTVGKSIGLVSSQVGFSYFNENKSGKIMIKNVEKTDIIKIYNVDTKKLIANGKGANPITISNIGSYKRLLVTRTSATKTESNGYVLTLPKPVPVQTAAISKNNVIVKKYGTKAKFTFSGLQTNTLVTIYQPTTKKKIASFTYSSKNNVYDLANANKYSYVSVTAKAPGKTESKTYSVTIPKK